MLLYFEENSVENAKKVTVLLTVIWSKFYGLLKSLLATA